MSNLNPKELEKIIKGFANRRRIAMVRLIRTKRSVTLGDVADEIKLSYKTTSKHLGILIGLGILEREQQGFRASYSIANDIPESARKILNII